VLRQFLRVFGAPILKADAIMTEFCAHQTASALPKAVQYLRMSTEHQRYSLENQAVRIAAYALERGYQVIDSYTDPGRSGLTLEGRPGLKRLLADAMQPNRPFQTVLVLDVSRWGRFQDPDQAAHYEFICREAGVNVVYCAEPFENDGTAVASILKTLKRVMAGEYSRELSEKVARAQLRQARLGFKQGGTLPYGFRRLLIDDKGNAKAFLQPGQIKALATDKVVFAHGSPEEVEVVRSIFRMWASQEAPWFEMKSLRL
jgi:DNA invertase Pin-like site-specific DNA recombinase